MNFNPTGKREMKNIFSPAEFELEFPDPEAPDLPMSQAASP